MMNTFIFLMSVATIGAAPPSVPVMQYKLPNGLTVVLSQDRRLPVVAVEMRYRVGSAHERKGRTGFAHLFEHLMFQGSKSYNDEYFKPFTPIGARINGTTSTDRTNYYVQLPAQYLELALWMESDRMEGLLPVLTKKKLDNQRDVVKNERRQNYEDRPYGKAWKLLANNLYPVGHPYHHLTIGSHADLTAASLADVKAFFRRYYGPANAILTIVGDFDVRRAKALVKGYFGSIPAGKAAPRPKAKQPSFKSIKKVVAQDKVKLARVYLAWPTPALYASGDAALDIWASVLSTGKTSRLYRRLVYDLKVAKDVSAYQVSRLNSGFFVVQATAAPGKTMAELYPAVVKALKEATSKPPTGDEFTRIVNAWKKSFFTRIESVLKKALLLSGYVHATGGADYLGKDLARYTSLTPKRVYAAVKRWLPLDRYLRVDILPKSKSGVTAKVEAAEVIAFFKRAEKALCACKDLSCLRRVGMALTSEGERFRDFKPSPEAKSAIAAHQQAAARCVKTLMKSGPKGGSR